MKKISTILLVILLMLACSTQAQNWQEWTQQKKTTIKYLVNQIAALQIYAVYVKKGYVIAKDGLDAIHNIKRGDLTLHVNYFKSLKAVNPNIKKYWKVAEIIALQFKIVQRYHKEKEAIRNCKQFTKNEINYCNEVFKNLVKGCLDIIDRLISITTDGNTELNDVERINRIDELYRDIKDKYVFMEDFSSGTNMLALQRIRDAGDIKIIRNLSDIRQ